MISAESFYFGQSGNPETTSQHYFSTPRPRDIVFVADPDNPVYSHGRLLQTGQMLSPWDQQRVKEENLPTSELIARYPDAETIQAALTDAEFEKRYEWTREEQAVAVEHHGWHPAMDESLARGGAWTTEMDESLGHMVDNPQLRFQ